MNKKNDNGSTALMKAAQNGHLNTLKILLQANADPTVANKDGQTAFKLAGKKNHANVV